MPLTPAQRFVLAVPWHAVLRWNAPWDRFGIVMRPARSADAVVALERFWGIVTAHDVERTLASLHASANVRDAAWHLSNAVFVAELAYAAYLLDGARAWQAAADAARTLQRHHRGWFSMAEAYLRGLATHRPESPDEGARDFLIALHAQPDSPWNSVAWTTELPEHIPPPFLGLGGVAAPVVVASAEALVEVLDADARAHVRLEPGVYAGAFVLRDQVLERAPDTLLGSVLLEAYDDDTPLLRTSGGVCLRGLVLRGGANAPAVAHASGFLRVEDARIEGGHVGIQVDGGAGQVQLADVACEGLSDSAFVLADATCRAREVTIAGVGGAGFALERVRLDLEEALLETADRAGILAVGGELALRRVRIHDAQRWGVALSGGARANLHDLEVVRAIVGVLASEGAYLHAERCRFADAATANLELRDIAGAKFVDCHVTGGEWAGVRMHPGHGTSFRGGQIGGSRLACLMIEGGRDVRLADVGLGPSREGGGLYIAGGADVAADNVFVSGAATAGIELRASRLHATDLRVRGSVEGLLVRDAGRLEAHRLDMADVRGSGLWVVCGTASVAGLGLRKVGFGLVVGGNATVLAQQLVCAHTPIVAQVEGGRLALTGRLTLGGGAVRVKGGMLAARGLEGTSVVASEAELYLEGGGAVAAGAIDVQGRSRVVLVRFTTTPDALATTAETEVVRDPAPLAPSVESPLVVALDGERLGHWGASADAAFVARLVTHLAARLGLGERAAVRVHEGLVKVDASAVVLTRLALAVAALSGEHGALGVLLAELVASPRPDPYDLGPPRGLA